MLINKYRPVPPRKLNFFAGSSSSWYCTCIWVFCWLSLTNSLPFPRCFNLLQSRPARKPESPDFCLLLSFALLISFEVRIRVWFWIRVRVWVWDTRRHFAVRCSFVECSTFCLTCRFFRFVMLRFVLGRFIIIYFLAYKLSCILLAVALFISIYVCAHFCCFVISQKKVASNKPGTFCGKPTQWWVQLSWVELRWDVDFDVDVNVNADDDDQRAIIAGTIQSTSKTADRLITERTWSPPEVVFFLVYSFFFCVCSHEVHFIYSINYRHELFMWNGRRAFPCHAPSHRAAHNLSRGSPSFRFRRLPRAS